MFKICKKSVYIDGKDQTVYGVKSKDLTYDDISPDLIMVERLVDILNEAEISNEHLRDIIEDFVASN